MRTEFQKTINGLDNALACLGGMPGRTCLTVHGDADESIVKEFYATCDAARCILLAAKYLALRGEAEVVKTSMTEVREGLPTAYRLKVTEGSDA